MRNIDNLALNLAIPPCPTENSMSDICPMENSTQDMCPAKNSTQDIDGIWCSVKKFHEINEWAKGVSIRQLRRYIQEKRFPLPSRKVASGRSGLPMYEILVTEPNDIQAFKTLRKNAQNALDQTSGKGQIEVTLPRNLVSILKSPERRIVAEATLILFFHCLQDDDMGQQKIQLSLPKELIKSIHLFAKKNKITVSTAFQIALTKMSQQNPIQERREK
jgi:hypothetical protein